jgi:Zn-dependent M28 family amino/carboxypeptidase
MIVSIKDSKEKETGGRRSVVKSMMFGSALVFILLAGLVFWLTQPLFSRPAAQRADLDVDPARLEAHVRRVSEEFYPRNHSNIANLDRTADHIKSEFEKSGGRLSEQPFQVNRRNYRNIIAVFGPETAERIVIGAHYDAADLTHGADDNASGVAGLIELAALFGKYPPPVQIELVAYTLEEPPFFGSEQMGSFVHAKSLTDRQVKVRLMISLEMIGFFTDRPGSQKYPVSVGRLLYPAEGNFVSLVGNFSNGLTTRSFKRSMGAATTLPVRSINAPGFTPGVDFSDHRNYWHFGYNALMITDTAFYRNANYHTVDDTAGTLDYARMAEVVKATYNAVLETANN